MATAAAAPPSLLSQVGMAGTAAVITVCLSRISLASLRLMTVENAFDDDNDDDKILYNDPRFLSHK
jgi:hypothetical protein